ncbi:MAG: hypothetical protein M3R38_04335 [Actinomycetota bacterium]|nr:hypothetical protein [Actinomycetota bacterium]
MNDEMLRFAAVLLFFVLILLGSYWFVLLPDQWTMRREGRGRDGDRHGKGRQKGF